MAGADEVRAAGLMAQGFRDLIRPPFSMLVLLDIFIALAVATLPAEDGGGGVAFLVLFLCSAYLQIALILAAGHADPERSADHWIRRALRQRCFLRFAGASLVTLLLVAVGLVAVVAGAFLVGAVVALAQPAAVLERRGPIDSVARSASLSAPVRLQTGIVYGLLFLAPAIAIQAGVLTGVAEDLGWAWAPLTLPALLLNAVAQISLSRAFRALGGDVLPAPEPASARNR